MLSILSKQRERGGGGGGTRAPLCIIVDAFCYRSMTATTVLKWGPVRNPPTTIMPMASHGSIHSLATTNKTELVWHLAHKPELKLSYITICVHRNIMWEERRKLHDILLLHTAYIMHVHD